MKHSHSGRYRSRTPRGRVIFKRRPTHRHRWPKYEKIVRTAQKKGYKVSDINRRNLTVDEVDIPESYLTDGLIIPDHDGKERRDLVYIDDDAKQENKRKAFAHELGHQHLFATGQDSEESNSNIPKIERKADKIAADILGMSVKEFNNPDVTFNDTVSSKRGHFFDEEDKEGKFFSSRRSEPEPEDKIEKLFSGKDRSLWRED